MRFTLLLSAAAALQGATAGTVEKRYTAPQGNGAFTWTSSSKAFSLNGKDYTIIGGQIDPQRVPQEYWAQRIQMAKSLGLNTIFSYMYWHEFELYPGQFSFSGRNNLTAWYDTIKAAGLNAVLRAGPHITAERDWGGNPGWLSQISGMQTRANNQPYLNRTNLYLQALGKVVQPYLVSQGGPILMVQVENEYGYAGNDMNYKQALSQQMANAFPGIRQYTNDPVSAITSGAIPGALAITDGSGPKGSVPQIRSHITDSSEQGPLMDGEVWITWFDSWGPHNGHTGNAESSGDIDWLLSQGDHFSIYMAHGGTSWGFGGGSNGNQVGLTSFITSYDYGAIIDESGRAANTYNAMRSAIAKHVSNIPAVPNNPPLQTIPSFTLTPVAGMFDNLASMTPVTSTSPQVMEAVNSQCFGYILYQYKSTVTASGTITVGNGPRDRVIIIVNGQRIGTLTAIYKSNPAVSVSIKPGDTLQLLVENLGRIDGGTGDQRRGIIGSVSVGGQTLTNWQHYNFQFDSPPTVATNKTVSVTSTSGPTYFHGTFNNPNTPGMASDTYLELPGGTKGVVWVNGHNLGRYWTIGPQQQLYLPGAWLNAPGTPNEVLVLELSPRTGSRTADGSASRKWGNNADPDCNGCS